LLKKKLSNEEIFYYAAYIHLVFVNIHPFNHGNGRVGLLLEKWFLSAALGETAWFIQSEKYYYQQVNTYYKNLNRLGIFYEKPDYAKADKFLQMLSERNSLKRKKLMNSCTGIFTINKISFRTKIYLHKNIIHEI